MSKRKCRGCGNRFPAETGIIVPLGFFCTHKCRVEYGIANAQKLAQRAAQRVKAQTSRKERADRESVRPRSWYIKKAQAAVNEYVRLRDADKPCISCGRPASWQGQWHCSHYRSVGSSPHLRFNLWNMHKACSICNNHLSGNVAQYKVWLILKIGPEKVEWLESEHSPQLAAKKHTVEYLCRLAGLFRRRCRVIKRRELKKGLTR